MKYVFVTGGVVSSLGKGLIAAALGTLLERRGLKVVLQKFDPYLNVDPGTMSPFQHGEVYVLDDGGETDLDLGHYERFTSAKLTRGNSLTTGQIYESVIAKERRGDYLGKTVQIIPHVTDEIKSRIRRVGQFQNCDIVITEIGGTTGDIEGLPFLEAIRQFALEVGPENALFLHVTLVPFITAAGELKTKPTQQSVAKLREIGLQPHILACRAEQPLDREIRQKLSMFCNVPTEAVIEVQDVAHTIYEAPIMLQREGLDDLVCKRLHLTLPPADMTSWRQFVDRIISPQHRVTIAVVGKYIELNDAYKSVYESLTHAAAAEDTELEVIKVDAEDIATEGAAKYLKGINGILVPGGFGERGIDGKIEACRYAREAKIPYLGLCLGMQIAVIEFSRNVLGIQDANSAEFDENTSNPVISLLDAQLSVVKKGGTMRLGSRPCALVPGTKVREAYGVDHITERHRHRYEFNNDYRDRLVAAGMVIAGTSPDGTLVECVELADHPWFAGCQYHPEFQSKPNAPHPLFQGFVHACLKNAGKI
jgi:CTP synthase